MEKIHVRITRPDFTLYDNIFTNVTISKDETGINVYVKESRMLVAFYPLRWAVEVVKVEIL